MKTRLLISIVMVGMILGAFTSMFGAFGQNKSKIDSLENILKTANEDTAKVDCLNKLSLQYRNISDNMTSMQYAESALELATTLDYKKGIAASYNNIGIFYRNQGNRPEALKNHFASLKIMEGIGFKRGIAYSYYLIGLIYRGQGNKPEALKYFFAAVKISEEIGKKRFAAISYDIIGSIYESQGNYPEALKNHFASLKIMEEVGANIGMARAYNNIGIAYKNQGNYPEALKNYFASIKLWEEIGNKGSMANTYNNIGNVYAQLGNYPEALKNHFASLKLREEIGDKKKVGISYLNIGSVKIQQGNYEEAKKDIHAAIKILEEVGYKKGIAESYVNIGIIYGSQGNYEEALKHCLAALKIHKEIGNKGSIANTYNNIGDYYQRQGNFQDARKYLNNGLALSKEIGKKDVIKESYNDLSTLDSAEGNFAQALEHYKMHTLYKDSLLNEESNNQIALLRIQYITEKKDREIELLNKDKALQEQKLENQRLLRNGMIAGVFLIVLVGLLLFRSFRLRKKLEKQQAIVQERHRISADLHDDVGSGLSKITLLSELLKTQAKTPENRKEAEKISETALDLSSTISEIIWALNSNNDYLENMVAYIRRYAAEYFENSPVNLKVNTSGDILPTPINGEHRRNIFYTVKEALNNILKHAEATEAELKFVVMNDKLDVIISDNGKGIPDGDLNRFGNGINNMRARMKSISGDFKIENHQGTRIFLKLAISYG